jgi:crossover junction endodeoxyribonuclease RuvC
LQEIAHGVIRTDAGDDVAQRLHRLQAQLREWIALHQPDVVAVEQVFAQHNVRTVMGTAQAAAVAITCATDAGVQVGLHTPSAVKAAVSGNGRADKAQVTAMVTRLLSLPAPPKPADSADALALAICEIWRGASLRRLQLAGAAR